MMKTTFHGREPTEEELQATIEMYESEEFQAAEAKAIEEFEKSTGVYYNAGFWLALDELVSESEIVIDRPKGSQHPSCPALIYPVDYGFLENTSSMDGNEIDVWKGSDGECVDAIICTIDLHKRDSEIKILIGCNEDEKQLIMEVHNDNEHMKGILIRRDNN